MEGDKIIESPHSVKLAVNQKGLFSGEVKCYGTTPEEALKRATELVKEVETLIKEKNSL